MRSRDWHVAESGCPAVLARAPSTSPSCLENESWICNVGSCCSDSTVFPILWVSVAAPCSWVLSPSGEGVLSALLLTILGFVQVTTNGIIAMSEPPAKESHPGLFPPSFGAVAPFLADLDTSDGLGKVYYREDLSPSIMQLAAECVQRGFPEVSFQPSSVVVVTWESVAAYQGPNQDPIQEGKVSTCPGRSSSCLTRCALCSFGLKYSYACVIDKHRRPKAESSRLAIAGLKLPKAFGKAVEISLVMIRLNAGTTPLASAAAASLATRGMVSSVLKKVIFFCMFDL